MKTRKAMILATTILVALLIGFFTGRWWGSMAADSGEQDRCVLSDDMTILNDEGRPAGIMPKGTKVYFMRDTPFVDDPREFFKAYFEIQSEHAALLKRDLTKSQYPREFYALVPKQASKKSRQH